MRSTKLKSTKNGSAKGKRKFFESQSKESKEYGVEDSESGSNVLSGRESTTNVIFEDNNRLSIARGQLNFDGSFLTGESPMDLDSQGVTFGASQDNAFSHRVGDHLPNSMARSLISTVNMDELSDQLPSQRPSVPFQSARVAEKASSGRKSTISSSFKRYKVTISAQQIEGLPVSTEKLQLRVKDRSREVTSEGSFTMDLEFKKDLSQEDLSLSFTTIVAGNVSKKVQLYIASQETMDPLFQTQIDLREAIVNPEATSQTLQLSHVREVENPCQPTIIVQISAKQSFESLLSLNSQQSSTDTDKLIIDQSSARPSVINRNPIDSNGPFRLQQLALTTRMNTAETQTSEDLDFAQKTYQAMTNMKSSPCTVSVKSTPTTMTSTQTEAEPQIKTGPSKAEYDQMKSLVEFLKQQALDKDQELNRKDQEIVKIQQACDFRLRASRQERNQMKEAILGMQTQVADTERQAAIHQESIQKYEAQIANLIESNLECNELQAKVRGLEQQLMQSRLQLAQILNEGF